MPDELLRIAYVFSGFDRVLGLHGRLRVDGADPAQGDPVLALDELLVACTGVAPGAGPDAGERPDPVRRALTECAWRAADGSSEAGGPWRSGAFELRVDERRGEGGERLRSVLLTLGGGRRWIPEYLERDLPRHVRALRAAPPWAPGPAPSGAADDLEEIAARLARRRLVVYTGAGVALESGIPAFAGPGSLDERFRLQEPFPGEVLTWMLARPAALADELRDFQARRITARPGIAHRLLAALEAAGVVEHIVTSSHDTLHELVGSAAVLTPAQLVATVRRPDATTLLVLGVPRDDEGVVAWARAAGMRVVAADVRPPVYLTERDRYVEADAATLLRALIAQGARPFPVHPRNVPAPARPRGPMQDTIPDLEALLGRVRWRSPSLSSAFHGDGHWRDTAWFGAAIALAEPACDPALVFLFALLHDSQRSGDGDDPDHGRRAAALIDDLRGGLLRLTDERAEILRAACADHAEGFVTAHPTIGACWDADRLGQWRLGVRPASAGLSLAVNRSADRIARARAEISTAAGWPALFALYDRLARRGG